MTSAETFTYPSNNETFNQPNNNPYQMNPNPMNPNIMMNPGQTNIPNNNIQMTPMYPQQPYPQQSYPQQPPQYQPDPYAQQQINQGIAQGFGQFFFNALDPNIAKTNVPVKVESSMHVPIIVTTLIMIGGVVGGVILARAPDTQVGGIVLIVIPYLIYLIVTCCCSDIKGYITNLKKFDDYKQTYDKMVAGRGYFHFWIECYHYITVRTKNGTRREKVVTHTASENYFPRESLDQSGNITGIKDITKYVFVNYLKRFYFTDARSQQTFTATYEAFISRNRRDQYQNHTQTFEIQGFQPQVGFCMQGDSPHNSIIFYVLTLIGLNLPYACILERSASRYAINILKRLTC